MPSFQFNRRRSLPQGLRFNRIVWWRRPRRRVLPTNDQDINASPVVITIAVPAPTLTIEINPSPVAITITPTAPAAAGSLDPGAIAIIINAPAPTLTIEVNPAPVAITIAPFAPTASSDLDPAPPATTINAPAPSLTVELNPGAVAASIEAPAPALTIELNPSPVATVITPTTPEAAGTSDPDALAIAINVPAPSLTIEINPDPVVVDLILPPPLVDSGQVPTPTPEDDGGGLRSGGGRYRAPEPYRPPPFIRPRVPVALAGAACAIIRTRAAVCVAIVSRGSRQSTSVSRSTLAATARVSSRCMILGERAVAVESSSVPLARIRDRALESPTRGAAARAMIIAPLAAHARDISSASASAEMFDVEAEELALLGILREEVLV